MKTERTLLPFKTKLYFLAGGQRTKKLKNGPCRSILEMDVDTVNDQKIIQKIYVSKLAKSSSLYIRRYFNTMLNLKLHI